MNTEVGDADHCTAAGGGRPVGGRSRPRQHSFELMDGRALTAGELAAVARVTAQTASSHLAKLVERGLLTVEKRGPRRFYWLATPPVAQMLESIMTVAVTGPPRFRPPSRIDSEMRRARTCYDHLAGELGVAVADAMIERRYVMLDADAGELTAEGSDFLVNLGADLISPVRSRRAFCRPCLDWSERRPHLPAGSAQRSPIWASSVTGSAGDVWAGQSKLPKAVSWHSERCLVCGFDFEGEFGYAPMGPPWPNVVPAACIFLDWRLWVFLRRGNL
jgi:hypothetical protein